MIKQQLSPHCPHCSFNLKGLGFAKEIQLMLTHLKTRSFKTKFDSARAVLDCIWVLVFESWISLQGIGSVVQK
jgi:hypothetical protein